MAAILTEKKKVKIVRSTCLFPIFLRWANAKGGFEYWLFDQRKTLSFRTQNQKTFQPFIQDIETDNALVSVLRKDGVDRALLFADQLTFNEALAMRGLLNSVYVSALINPETWSQDGARWQEIILDTSTFQIGDTSRNLYQVNFNISLQPKINITR